MRNKMPETVRGADRSCIHGESGLLLRIPDYSDYSSPLFSLTRKPREGTRRDYSGLKTVQAAEPHSSLIGKSGVSYTV